MPYALDNGAWSAHTQGVAFDTARFELAVAKLGARADWVVVPDVVADARATLTLAERWLPRLEHRCRRMLVAVQDGMTRDCVDAWLSTACGIFVGGSTEWKLRTLPYWGDVAAYRGCWLHVGRVNSEKRIVRCHEAGATSFDGTSATRYAENIARLDRALLRPHLAFRAPWVWDQVEQRVANDLRRLAASPERAVFFGSLDDDAIARLVAGIVT